MVFIFHHREKRYCERCQKKLRDIALDFGTEHKSTAESSDKEETYEPPDGNIIQCLMSFCVVLTHKLSVVRCVSAFLKAPWWLVERALSLGVHMFDPHLCPDTSTGCTDILSILSIRKKQTNAPLFRAGRPLEIEVRERTVLSRFGVQSCFLISEASVLSDRTTKSAKKL